MNPLTPIKLLPARERVAAALREAILIQTLKNGQELSLKELSTILCVSVTPIREAFQMLAREGLIELRPNRGAVVLGFSEKRIRDHYQARAVLEREAIMAVCRNGANLDAIRNAYAQADATLQNHNTQLYSNYNQAFHMAIWTAAENEVMLDLLSGLWNGLSMGDGDTTESYALVSMSEHKLIMEALETGDEQKAGSLMYAHIQRSMRNVLVSFS